MAATRSFLVERYVPGAGAAGFARLRDRLEAAFGPADRSVRYRGSILVPSDDACLCLFDAASEEEVLAANRAAEIALDRVVEISLGFEAWPPTSSESSLADELPTDSRRTS